LKNSLDAIGAYTLVQLNLMMPFKIAAMLTDHVTQQYSLAFSNLNATKVPYTFDGKKQLGCFYYLGGMGNIHTGITVNTCGPFMSISIMTD
jgi:hypothetical protein